MNNLNGIVFKGVVSDIDFFKTTDDASVLCASCGDVVGVQYNYKICEYCGHKQRSMTQCPKCNSIRISEKCDMILYMFTGDEWIQMENYAFTHDEWVQVNGNNIDMPKPALDSYPTFNIINNEFDDKGFFNDNAEYPNSSKNIFKIIIHFLQKIASKSNKKQRIKNKKDDLIVELYE